MRKKIESLEQLIQLVDMHIQLQMKSNLQELHLTGRQNKILEKQKKELKQMLRRCGIGDIVAKEYIKQTISAILTEKVHMTQEEMEAVFPIHNKNNMTERDMFEVMLCSYEKEHQKKALAKWIQEHHLEESRGSETDVYEITKEQVREIYLTRTYEVSSLDWQNLIVQRIYAEYRGLGVVDAIRDMDIDGVSGGVNGSGEEERSVWIMFQGKSIYLSFLCFGSEKNLQRVCRTIYRHGQPGQLSRKRGYVVNEMADHARIVVARPDFCENWVFFVRKLDNLESRKLEDLFQGRNVEVAATFLKYIVKGCQTIAITGVQGSGKTTLLMSLIEFIEASYTLRIQETAFELQLRRLFPKRNIVSFRETESVSGQEGLDFQKKTDGMVSIVGEVASDRQAALMLQLGQTASLFTMFTHHANSTRNLVWALQNSLLKEGQFSNEQMAQQQVVEAVRFHVHLVKDVGGNRYIDYISEVIPAYQKDCGGACYEERILICRKGDEYQVISHISEESLQKMSLYIREEERRQYDQQIMCCFREASMA